MPYVYSTATGSVSFHVFEKISEEEITRRKQSNSQEISIPKILKTITIKGGAGLRTIRNIETPKGVATLVTDEDLEYLKTDFTFKQMVKNNFITFDEKSRNAKDIDKMVADLAPKDLSAQKTPEDYSRPGSAAKVAKSSLGPKQSNLV
jgi:hypothetical protein